VTREHRRLAAIVSADVVGYSLLMGRDESATLSA
jgi:adenylate cyclase